MVIIIANYSVMRKTIIVNHRVERISSSSNNRVACIGLIQLQMIIINCG